MLVLVVGFGSMGRRRIRLVKEVIREVEFICVDGKESRRIQAKEAGFIVYENLREGIDRNPEIAFVCTSPGNHAEIILQLLKAGIHVFTELNLTSDRYEEIITESQRNRTCIFMSSTMLYKRQIEIIIEHVRSQTRPLSYIFHVGQYLPDWHPWDDYREFFAGNKETNGIREFLAVHLPWLIDAFGTVSHVNSEWTRCTDLEIDYPDAVCITMRHDNGCIGALLFDVVSRKTVNRLEIIGEKLQIAWNGHNDDFYIRDTDSGELKQITVYSREEHVDGYSDVIAEQPYREEIRAFLDMILKNKRPRYTLENDKYVLSIIDLIEEKM